MNMSDQYLLARVRFEQPWSQDTDNDVAPIREGVSQQIGIRGDMRNEGKRQRNGPDRLAHEKVSAHKSALSKSRRSVTLRNMLLSHYVRSTESPEIVTVQLNVTKISIWVSLMISNSTLRLILIEPIQAMCLPALRAQKPISVS